MNAPVDPAQVSVLIPAILCGGSGSRLWPLSRLDRPKQLLALDGGDTLLDRTIDRCLGLGAPLLIGASEHVHPMSQALRRRGQAVDVIAEPCGRNTAAAAAAVALEIEARGGDGLVLLTPADHRVADPEAFEAAVERGIPLAREGRIVIFGIEPDGPCTRYGYLRPDGDRVAAFVEKPDLPDAERYLAEGWLWNAGMFLFRPADLLAAFERHAPRVLDAVRRSLEASSRDAGVLHLAASWSEVPSEPLDEAVMEKTDAAAVVPVSMGWTDVGTYDALHATMAGEDGNATVGDVVSENATGNYLHAEGVLLAVQDVEDLVVVATPDATLVAPRSSASDLKRVVARLEGRQEVREHRSSQRPWGSYRVLERGDGFQVKRLTIEPGHSLSLQLHHQRDEHWIVVHGHGSVQLDGEERTVGPNDHVLVPLGVPHRLHNPGTEPMVLVEVQVGAYLAEDDIERLDDRYGRR